MHKARPSAPAELVRMAASSADGALAFLADAGGRLVGTVEVDAAATLVVELAVPTLADCAMVLLPDVRGRLDWWRWSPGGRCTRGRVRRPATDAAPALSAGLEGLKQVSEMLPAEAAGLPRALAEPLTRYDQVSVVALPVTDAGTSPGVLLLARAAPVAVAEALIAGFADRASRVIAAAQRYERLHNAAMELQSTLRPAALPALPGIRLAAIYRPSAGPVDVGGDFYDLYPEEDGGVLFALGDVCGNGAEAAALGGRVRQTLGALRLVEDDPARLLRLVNRASLGMGNTSKFATVVVGSISRGTGGELSLRLSSGGHPSPLVLRRDGVVETISVPGMLVGIVPEAQFGENSVELGPQDICVLYTDGITEARGGVGGEELFGSDRLRAVLAECADLPVEQVAARVDQAVQRWSGGDSRDDIALLAIQSMPGT
ncbi:MAG: PP2C family protein-serine/threonine phosphatase [Labedaea sp.]